jgi:hypothetical protein
VAIPLAALALAVRRERHGREVLGLPPPPPERRLPRALAVAAVPVLLGVAASQPALRTTSHVRVRTDAQALFVLDISRSMLAAREPGARTRLARAKEDAMAMRDAIPEVPSGVATLTDRVLPDLLPNADPSVFRGTIEQAVAIERPPPASTDVTASTLGALGAIGTQNFFPPAATRRLVLVLTDGESRPFDPRQVAHALAAGPGVRLILVHVWAAGEAVYVGGRAEPGYRVDPASAQALASLASAAGGAVFGEHSLAGAIRAARADLGAGPTVRMGKAERTRSLAPYVVLASLLPLLSVALPGMTRGLRRSLRDEPATARPLRTT